MELVRSDSGLFFRSVGHVTCLGLALDKPSPGSSGEPSLEKILQWGDFCKFTTVSKAMALKEFLNSKKEKIDDFESPDAFEKEDCLSCRVLGLSHWV